jgi:glycosyltransferase involved in cell wall biosynthesis
MISALIPIHNEEISLLTEVLNNLIYGIRPEELEIVIVNDGSCNPDGSFASITMEQIPWPNAQIINNTKQWGVGYSFDRAAEIAKGEILVIMGADVFPMHGWAKITELVKPKEIGCAVSVGLQPDNHDINKLGLYRRYGAKLLYTIGHDDLPKKSPLRKNKNYTSILEGQFQPKLSDEPYEISCLMGACYWITKEFYQNIGGFDTASGIRQWGHSYYGCLEPHLSLKAKCYDGKCVLYPNIEAGHVFGKIDDISKVRAVRDDYVWYNRLWVAHTLLDDDLRDEVIHFPHSEWNFNVAKVWIRQNWSTVCSVRELNKSRGKLICEKMN